MRRENILCTLLLAGCLLFSGCGMPGVSGNINMENMLRAPQLSDDTGTLKAVLDDALNENVQLKYPSNGEFLSPFLWGDWDGDGSEDAAVLYQMDESANVHLAVLHRENESWRLYGTIEGLSSAVERVSFARLHDGAQNQIVVGYITGEARYLAVYTVEDGELRAILETPYTQVIIEDITGGGLEDIVLLAEDAATEKMQVQLLTAAGEGFTVAEALALPSSQFAGCASISAGRGRDGRTYLVLDGWTGSSGSYLASVLLRYDADAGRLTEARLPWVEDLYAATLRYSTVLTSRDLNGDGVVEIPTQSERPGFLNLCAERRLGFVFWRDFTAAEENDSFGLFDDEKGFYLALPEQWRGNLLLTSEEETGYVKLMNLSGEQLYFTLRVTDARVAESGWRRLAVLPGGQLQLRLGPEVTDVTMSDLIRGLYLL